MNYSSGHELRRKASMQEICKYFIKLNKIMNLRTEKKNVFFELLKEIEKKIDE